ncbi:TraM recognition domain-containing protein [bacterium]|nr:TraM recognition domain-containing protein [bacterium]
MSGLRHDQALVLLAARDTLTLGQLMQGTLITGCTGCGKSTGSLYALTMAFLLAGMGGLILTCKRDDAETIRRYARQVGREHQLIVVRPGGPWRCDLLNYEVQRPGLGAGLTENLYRLLASLSELGERAGTGGQNEGYWNNAKAQLFRALIDVVRAAYGTVTLQHLHEVLQTAPLCLADLESERWQEHSAFFTAVTIAEQQPLSARDRHDFEHSLRYFFSEFVYLAEKTRSIVVSSVSGLLDILLRGVLRELFATDTTFIPEMCFGASRAIIVLDIPTKEYGDVGRYGQAMFRLIWQRAMERRDVQQYPAPVFLIADEFQSVVVSEDKDFQATARSSRVCTVYATQNLPGLYAALGGGDAGKQRAEAILANLHTKILHANGDSVTNDWASELISKSWQFRSSVGANSAPGGEQLALFRNLYDRSVNASVNETLEYDVPPQTFTRLQMGGPPHFCSEAIVFQPGRTFALTGKTYLPVLFPQGVR